MRHADPPCHPTLASPAFHHDGHEDIGRATHFDALESGRRNSDHCQRMAIHLDRVLKDILVASELALPVPVCEHGNGMRFRLQIIFRTQ